MIGESVGLIIRLVGMVISPGRHEGAVVPSADLHTVLEQGVLAHPVTHPVQAAPEVGDTHEITHETEEEIAMRLEVEQLEADVEQLEAEFLIAKTTKAALTLQTRLLSRLIHVQLAAMEEVNTSRHAEEERLKAIAQATRVAEEDQEAQRRKKEELRRLAAKKEIARWEAGAATAIQRRQRGIVARQRVASKKRVRTDWCILRPPDAFDVCILRKQARPALAVIQAHSLIMAGYAREQRESHRQLLRNLEYLEAQVGEYLEANHRLSRQRSALRTVMELVHGQVPGAELGTEDEFEA
jgi:hypothetical protein